MVNEDLYQDAILRRIFGRFFRKHARHARHGPVRDERARYSDDSEHVSVACRCGAMVTFSTEQWADVAYTPFRTRPRIARILDEMRNAHRASPAVGV